MLIPRRTDDGKGDPVSDGHEDGARPPGYRLMLREMAADERPREKLKLRGSTALSDGELLAIILNTGSVGETVTDLSQRLLAQYGGLRGLFRMDIAELTRRDRLLKSTANATRPGPFIAGARPKYQSAASATSPPLWCRRTTGSSKRYPRILVGRDGEGNGCADPGILSELANVIIMSHTIRPRPAFPAR